MYPVYKNLESTKKITHHIIKTCTRFAGLNSHTISISIHYDIPLTLMFREEALYPFPYFFPGSARWKYTLIQFSELSNTTDTYIPSLHNSNNL